MKNRNDVNLSLCLLIYEKMETNSTPYRDNSFFLAYEFKNFLELQYFPLPSTFKVNIRLMLYLPGSLTLNFGKKKYLSSLTL